MAFADRDRDISIDDVPEEVREMIQRASDDGRISCAKAWEVAREQGVPFRTVGDAANVMGIKIVQCQLGCF